MVPGEVAPRREVEGGTGVGGKQPNPGALAETTDAPVQLEQQLPAAAVLTIDEHADGCLHAWDHNNVVGGAWSDVPHFSRGVWPPTSGAVAGVVDVGGDVQEVEHLLLQWGEFGLEGLHYLAVLVDELVTLDVVEDLQDPGRAGGGAVP